MGGGASKVQIVPSDDSKLVSENASLKILLLEHEAKDAMALDAKKWMQQPNNSTTPIPPCPLEPGKISDSVVAPSDDKRRVWISDQARTDYAAACRVFELILSSVAYDNAGVVWVVNELRDRVVKLIREMAELELREATTPDGPSPTFVTDRLARTFANSSNSGFGAFGDEATAVHALLEDGTRCRLREKLGVSLKCEELCAALDSIAALLPSTKEGLSAPSKSATAEETEMDGWAESRLCLQLGIDLAFVSERRSRYLEACESGEITPVADGASLWDAWVQKWSRRGEVWTRRQGEFRQKTKEADGTAQPVIDAAFLKGLDVGLSAPETSFSHILAERKRNAAASTTSIADPEREVVPWHTGDMCWEVVPGSDLATAAEQALLGLRASSSGTTFTLLIVARYLGMTGDKIHLLKLAALAFLAPQHHTFLEVMLGSSEFCGTGTLEAGSECWTSLLPPDFSFQVPSGPLITRESFNAEVRREMEGTGDIRADVLAASQTGYAKDFAKYRAQWPSYWLSVEHQRHLAAEYDRLHAK